MGILAGMFMVFVILMVVIMLIPMIGAAKVYSKAGKPGWAVIIPIYNQLTLLDIIGKPRTRFWYYLIPFYGIYCAVVDLNDLCKSFGKDGSFTAGLILLPPIFWCILGFGSAQYLGPAGSAHYGQQMQPHPGYPPQPGPPMA